MNYSYSKIAERHLSKNKKYYKHKVQKKDKENILQGDIDSIIEKLSFQHTVPIAHQHSTSSYKRSSAILQSL